MSDDQPAERARLTRTDFLAAFDDMKAKLDAARAAIDSYASVRAAYIAAHPVNFRLDIGPPHDDVRQSQERVLRMVRLIVLTFHPDMSPSMQSYGPPLGAVIASERGLADVLEPLPPQQEENHHAAH